MKQLLLLGLAAFTLQAKVIEVEGQKQLDDILNKNPYVVVKFYRPGCPACKKIEQDYIDVEREINEKHKKKIIFININTNKEQNKKVYPEWDVKGVPALFAVKKGSRKEITRKSSDFKKSFIEAIEKNFGSLD